LIENDSVEEIIQYVSKNYKKKFNIDSKTYVTKINNGTSIISVKENAAQ
jgi:galactokinase